MKTQETMTTCPAISAARGASCAAWLSAVYVVVGCLVMSLSAQVRIPIPGTDVPMTLQLLAVFYIGFALRPALAVSAMVLYFGCGASGLPVFAGSAGLAGTTAGYIIGFVPAVWLVSAIANRREASFLRMLVAGVCGTSIVFALGTGWRFVFFGPLGGEALSLAVLAGVAPFAVKAIVELVLAVGSVRSVRRLFSGRGASARPNHGMDQV